MSPFLWLIGIGLMFALMGGIGFVIGVLIIVPTLWVLLIGGGILTVEWFKDEIKLWRKP